LGGETPKKAPALLQRRVDLAVLSSRLEALGWLSKARVMAATAAICGASASPFLSTTDIAETTEMQQKAYSTLSALCGRLFYDSNRL
jgi:hypothetical protein